MRNLPNIVSALRILCGIAILFCPVFSIAFYSLYITAGLSDIADGWIARKTNIVSAFGAKLDTVADFVFVVACLVKLLPIMDIPVWLYVWIGVIALIKAINIILGYIVQKQFVSVHSVMNKATGVLLLLLPITVSFISIKYSVTAICIIATFAAIQEGHLIRTKNSN
jgi:CDP-diacylglycerol--glycerol-3-phosphate 3-phosphatidyltransferase